MKKQKRFATLVFLAIFLCAFSITAYANSSWRWISDSRPYDILPFVIIGTLMIETIAINYIAAIHKGVKVFCIVTIGNLLSYIAPYGLLKAISSWESLYSFSQTLEHLPVYNIGFIYLFLTIAIELPFNYLLLKRHTKKKKVLLYTIIITNAATTALVSMVERIICPGQW